MTLICPKSVLNQASKAQATKAKIGTGATPGYKTSAQQRKQPRVKRQPTEWENTFTNYISAKELV
jgi:hypothetical protein